MCFATTAPPIPLGATTLPVVGLCAAALASSPGSTDIALSAVCLFAVALFWFIQLIAK